MILFVYISESKNCIVFSRLKVNYDLCQMANVLGYWHHKEQDYHRLALLT